MEKQHFTIDYNVYDGIDNLAESDQQLLKEAFAVFENAYAPYSKFRVGAAVLLANGEVISAANQENSSFPLGNCAEHIALNYANARYPDIPVVAVAITASSLTMKLNEPVMPCGGCRQVLCETERRFKTPIRLILQGETGKIAVFERASKLLPFAFELDS